MTDRYAVFGNPVAQSRSPQIHAEFASQFGESISYEKICVEPETFDREVAAFFNTGGSGLNITVPFKLEAHALAETLSVRAELAGAVNTLLQKDGKLHGDNTDGVGLARDLQQNLGWKLEGSRILVLGAGGAVRGVLAPLLEAGPKELVVANRTVAKAEMLCDLFAAVAGEQRVALGYSAFDALKGGFDVVINGTSASLGDALPPISGEIVAGAHCYDMMYGAGETVFLGWAKQNRALEIADGLGMLVEQAAESYFLWRDRRPHTGTVIASIRDSL